MTAPIKCGLTDFASTSSFQYLVPPISCPFSCSQVGPSHDAILSHVIQDHRVMIPRPKEVRFFLEKYLAKKDDPSGSSKETLNIQENEEDSLLRRSLAACKLADILQVQQNERQHLYPLSFSCPFCDTVLSSWYSIL
jgi:hypothetical protein